MALSKKQKDWWLVEFSPDSLSGLTRWGDDPAISFKTIDNVLEDGSNNVRSWLSKDQDYTLTNFVVDVGLDGGGTLTINSDDGNGNLQLTSTAASQFESCNTQINLTINKLSVIKVTFNVVAITNNWRFGFSGARGSNVNRSDRIDVSAEGEVVEFILMDNTIDASIFFVIVNLTGSGDTITIEDLVIEKVEGNHFGQDTGADQPNRLGSEITFDGANEFLDGTPNIANFNQSSGEFFFVANDLEGLGVRNVFMAFGDASTDNEHLAFGIGTDDKVFIENRTGGVSNTVTFGVVARGTTAIYSFSSSGTNYKCQVNGIDLVTDGGTDNGNWVADNVLLDTLALAAIIKTTNEFFFVALESDLYYNRQLTTAERLQVRIFLNKSFNIF